VGESHPLGGISLKIQNVSGAIGAYSQNTTRKVADVKEVARVGKTDGVQLSKEAQEVLNLKDKVTQAPEVRGERVTELRRQIESGTYRPSGQEVAANMLKAGVVDDLV